MPASPVQRTAPCLALIGLLGAFSGAVAAPTRVTDVRLWSGPEGTRLVLDLSAPAQYQVFAVENPDRIVIDLANADLATAKGLPAGQGPVKAVRSGPQANHGLRLVLDLSSPQKMKSFPVGPDGSAGHRLVVELPPSAAAVSPGTPAPKPQSPPEAKLRLLSSWKSPRLTTLPASI